MSEEQKEAKEDKKNLRMSSVLAAALAAVTAALLGSTLGVAEQSSALGWPVWSARSAASCTCALCSALVMPRRRRWRRLPG